MTQWFKKKKKACQYRRHGFNPYSRKWQPTPVLLPGKFHEQRRSLVGYSPWGLKESDTTEYTHTHTISITLLTLQLIIKYLNHEKELIVILTYTVNLYVNRYSVLKTFRLYMNNRVLSSILFDLLTMLWKTIIKW